MSDQRQLTILYVEDNPSNVIVVDRIVESLGHKLLVAVNGGEGINMAFEHRPDVILMDINLPDIDGLTATKRIRENPDMQNVPIIAITARAMTGDREKCLAAGCNEYLAKPFQVNMLVDILKRMIEITIQ